MKRKLIALCTSVLLAGAALLGGAAVAANAAPAAPYVLAAWTVPGGPGNIWEPDQILFSSVEQTTPDLDALDAGLACGAYYQIDLYNNNGITTELLKGEVLYSPNHPEESLAFGAVEGNPWKYVTTAECPPPPVSCTVTSPWFTEPDDAAPSLTPEGLLFTGSGPGKAMGYGVQIAGNLQGLNDLTFTTDYTSPKFYFRYVIDSSADGGWTYQSLTVSSGSPITGSSVAYSNKVGTSHTLDEWAALYPHNQLRFAFFQTDSAAVVTDTALLTSVTSDCINANFVSEKPADVPSSSVSSETICESATVETTTINYVATASWVDGAWVMGDPVEVSRNTVSRDATAAELNEAECPGPEKPEIIPTVVVEEDVTCDADTVEVTTTTTTPTFTYDAETRTWVAGKDVVDVVVTHRDKTLAEVAACVFPPALALTGIDNPVLPGLLALLLILVGVIVFVAVKRHQWNVENKN